MTAAPRPPTLDPPRQPADPLSERLITLVTLEGKARDCETAAEVGYLLVNDTAQLVPYMQAVLWRSGRVAAVNGLPDPVGDAPLTVLAGRICRHLSGADAPAGPRVVDRAALPPDIAREWPEVLPAHAVWVPLAAGGGGAGGLLLLRPAPWSDAELKVVGLWCQAAGHALDALEARRPLLGALARGAMRRRGWLLVVAVALVAALFLPVRLSVLGPAEVVAADPYVVRAPLSGVVDEVVVAPNAPVRPGDVLLRLDARELRSRRDVVTQQLEVAQVEYRQAVQSGIVDQRAQTEAAILAARVAERRAEVAEVEELLSRVDIVSDRAGVALVPDPSALRGRPVRLGERLIGVADPDRVAIEVWIAVADAIDFAVGAPVSLYLNVAPDRAVPGHLRFVSYQATESPSGTLAFRGLADLAEGAAPPRVGLRGTARVSGQSVSLFYYLFRRPLAAVRQLVGV